LIEEWIVEGSLVEACAARRYNGQTTKMIIEQRIVEGSLVEACAARRQEVRRCLGVSCTEM
jgi:hypothetical protein